MTQTFVPDPSAETAEIPPCRRPSNPHQQPLRHLLIGSPKAVQGTIHTLHVLGYAEVGEWSRLIPTTNPGEVVSILVRRVRLQE
ncbi:MAG: hypothetical protein SW833_21880 [Cyanobacteriota bacterium]|nr:hypothetical protein [Cyanobacteriota bacterium]